MLTDSGSISLPFWFADETGAPPLPNPPIIWDIESDPVLAGTKMIAEAWDAAGFYQVGSLVGDSWKEWNGRFRDDVKPFFVATPVFRASRTGCSAAPRFMLIKDARPNRASTS